MNSFAATGAFYFRLGWFQFREQFSDVASGLVGYLLFPFFMFILGKLWERFNSFQGNFSIAEVMSYVAVTEIFFMTFLRSAVFGRATADFSLSLARPRNWLAMSFVSVFSRTLSARILLWCTFILFAPLLGIPQKMLIDVATRALLFLLPLTVWSALFSLLFASAQVFWEKTQYFTLPISKIFLALGGVFGPLNDYAEPWLSYLTSMPSSDIFFQVGYFCVRGEFYHLTPAEWLMRVAIQCLLLAVAAQIFFQVARKHHQSYGG